MSRRLDWPEQLAACVEAAERRRFVWGEHDCVLFACTVVQAMTGTDPGAAIRGTYQDEAGAHIVVAAIAPTFPNAIAEVCVEHGYLQISPAYAQRGDVVLCPSGVESWPLALGVCLGAVAAIPKRTGLLRCPMAQAVAAWRIA